MGSTNSICGVWIPGATNTTLGPYGMAFGSLPNSGSNGGDNTKTDSIKYTSRSGETWFRFNTTVGRNYTLRVTFSETWYNGTIQLNPGCNATGGRCGWRWFHMDIKYPALNRGGRWLSNFGLPDSTPVNQLYSTTTRNISIYAPSNNFEFWTVAHTNDLHLDQLYQTCGSACVTLRDLQPGGIAGIELWDNGIPDIACNQVQPTDIWTYTATGAQMTCHDMVPQSERERGLGAYYDPTVDGGALGSWWISFELNRPFCRQCRFSNASVFSYLTSADILDCPPCVQQLYLTRYGASVEGGPIPLQPPINNTGCPAGWLKSDVTGNCYLRSGPAAGMKYWDAVAYCQNFSDSSANVQLLKVETNAEQQWLGLNLMWLNGFQSDLWTGLYKPPGGTVYQWADNSSINSNGFRFWGPPGSPTYADDNTAPDPVSGVCVKYLPHVDPYPTGPNSWTKHWIPWDCNAKIAFVCERYALSSGASTTSAPVPSGKASSAGPSNSVVAGAAIGAICGIALLAGVALVAIRRNGIRAAVAPSVVAVRPSSGRPVPLQPWQADAAANPTTSNSLYSRPGRGTNANAVPAAAW